MVWSRMKYDLDLVNIFKGGLNDLLMVYVVVRESQELRLNLSFLV